MIQTLVRKRGIVLLMVCLSVMSYFDRIIMSTAGPFIMNESKLTETQMGSIYSAFTLSYALLMIPGGRVADRFGPRRVLTIMSLGAAFFTALTALGGRPVFGIWLGVLPSFLGIRLALGVLTAPLYPSCAILNARWIAPAHRARTWGLVACGSGIGGALAPLLFSWMMGQYGWRLSFVFSGIVTALFGVLWFLWVRDFPQGASAEATSAPRTATPWRALFTNRDLMLLTASYVTANYFEYIFFYWMFYYFGSIRHVGTRESAIYSAIIWTAWTLMTPTGGWISDRLVSRYGRKLGRRLMPIFSLTVAAVLLAVAVNLTDTTPMIVLLFITLGLAAATDGPYWVSSSDLGGSHVGAAGGILNTGGNVGGFLAPVLTPFLASRLGWTNALYAGSLILLIGVVLWFFIDVTNTVAVSEPVSEPAST